MRKKIVKEINKIAAELPDVMNEVHVRISAIGSELIEQGTTHVDGKPVDPKRNYFGMSTVLQPLNTKNGMKKAYKKGGKAAIVKYIKWCMAQNARMKKKYPNVVSSKKFHSKIEEDPNLKEQVTEEINQVLKKTYAKLKKEGLHQT